MVRTMNEMEILNAALAVGWVKFAYFKADGTKRIAIGTRNRALIEQTLGRALRESNTGGEFYRSCNGYFDLARLDWRQFKTERFIGIELDRLTNEQAATAAVAILTTDGEPANNLTFAFCNLLGELDALPIIRAAQMCQDETDDTDELIGLVGAKVGVVFGAPKAEITINQVEHAWERKKANADRAALKAELAAIRKRESEILEILLVD